SGPLAAGPATRRHAQAVGDDGLEHRPDRCRLRIRQPRHAPAELRAGLLDHAHLIPAPVPAGLRWAWTNLITRRACSAEGRPDRGVEGLEVAGVAGRDEVPVDDDLLVDPLRTGILEVDPRRRVRGEVAALGDP